jgi:hypothetical protein
MIMTYLILTPKICPKNDFGREKRPAERVPLMNSVRALRELMELGYRFEVAGDLVRYEYTGQGDPDPYEVDSLLETVKVHKEDVRRYLSRAQQKGHSPPERILSCNECPWHQKNPWTHYPGLRAWCHYNMDAILTDNPACISFRRGEMPPREKP